jgi:hypothetical protein
MKLSGEVIGIENVGVYSALCPKGAGVRRLGRQDW